MTLIVFLTSGLINAGEVCAKDVLFLNANVIWEEEMYVGFYAVCTNLEDMVVDEIIRINKKRWEIEECFHIMKTEFKSRPTYPSKEERIWAYFLTCYLTLFV